MFENGLKYKTKSWTISLQLYGSTIGTTGYPQYIKDDEYKILPWPYHISKPGNKGEGKLVQSFWFLDLIKHIEQITFQYFHQIYPYKKKQQVILHMMQAKGLIPSRFKIGETFFIHVGN